MQDIILKNKALVNMTFIPRQQKGSVYHYTRAGASLMDTMRLELDLRESQATNRVVGKLSVPSVGTNPSTGQPVVQWTEIGSFDLSSVKAAATIAAEDFFAMFASLVASDVVKQMYVNGART